MYVPWGLIFRRWYWSVVFLPAIPSGTGHVSMLVGQNNVMRGETCCWITWLSWIFQWSSMSMYRPSSELDQAWSGIGNLFRFHLRGIFFACCGATWWFILSIGYPGFLRVRSLAECILGILRHVLSGTWSCRRLSRYSEQPVLLSIISVLTLIGLYRKTYLPGHVMILENTATNLLMANLSGWQSYPVWGISFSLTLR